jgi:hypothetical protein
MYRSKSAYPTTEKQSYPICIEKILNKTVTCLEKGWETINIYICMSLGLTQFINMQLE